MHQVNRMWQLLNAAGTVRDIARHTRTYHFAAAPATTFYLRTESATVQIIRWVKPLIEVTTRLNGAFGWRVLAEHDEVGVYVAAKRRAVIGTLSSAIFEVRLPYDAHTILKLEACDLHIANLNGEIQIPANFITPQAPVMLLGAGDDD